MPVTVAAVLAVTLAREQKAVQHDLQLVAPRSARPGSHIAVRAFFFRGIHRPTGGTLDAFPLNIRLTDSEGSSTLASTTLAPSHAGGMEGTLKIPARRGSFFLEARVQVDDSEILVRRTLKIRKVGASTSAKLRDRLSSPLQQYAPQSIKVLAEEPPPDRFEVRVRGGACVPGTRCDLLVWVGSPAAHISLDESPSVKRFTPARSDGSPSAGGSPSATETDNIVVVPVVVHGPEGTATLIASRQGTAVAQRTLQLPVSLGAPRVHVEPVLLRAPARPTLLVRQIGAARPLMIDGYRNGQWEQTASVDASIARAAFEIPFALGAGTWRIEVRRDAFASTSAGCRLVDVYARANSIGDAIDRLSQKPSAPPKDAWHPPEDAAAFVFAAEESKAAIRPPASRSVDQSSLGARKDRKRGRLIGAGLVIALGFLASLLLVQQGLRATREAQSLLARAVSGDDSNGGDDRPREGLGRRQALPVWGLSALLALIFTLIGLLVVARIVW